jgi:hypothetical protein
MDQEKNLDRIVSLKATKTIDELSEQISQEQGRKIASAAATGNLHSGGKVWTRARAIPSARSVRLSHRLHRETLMTISFRLMTPRCQQQ